MRRDNIAYWDILKFDQLTDNILTVWERMAVHQFVGQDIPVPKSTSIKLQVLKNKIEKVKWKAPLVFYNAARELEVELEEIE